MTRYAVYWTPDEASDLWRAGAEWLGRDPAGGPIAARPALPEDVTRDAALYGFHATLKPPMRLREGASADDLLTAARAVAASVPAFDLPTLGVDSLDGFLCLREAAASVALQAYCDAFVAGLDSLRAPPKEDELARRRAAGLAPIQEANLRLWGYPHVFAAWVFHMTLTRRLSEGETAVLRPRAEAWFAGSLALPLHVADVSLFVQEAVGAPFSLLARVPLA